MKYLIFDFDGVLGDTWEPRMEILLEIGTIFGSKSKEEILKHTDQYFTKSSHTRDLNLNSEAVASIGDWMIKFGNLMVKKGFKLFDGFIEELKKIEDTKMAIVSSASAVYVKPAIEKSGLTFSHIMTFEDHHSKEEKVEQICKEWNISVKDAYFFTDTVSDVNEVGNIMDKSKIYGCAWGYQGAEKLAMVLDENHILTDFSDIQKIPWT